MFMQVVAVRSDPVVVCYNIDTIASRFDSASHPGPPEGVFGTQDKDLQRASETAQYLSRLTSRTRY